MRSSLTRRLAGVFRAQPADPGQGVTGIELFFDILTAFSLSQIASVILNDPTPHGVARGLLVLGLIWGFRCNYAWAANSVRVDAGAVQTLHVAAMAGLVLLGLSLPLAFDSGPGLTARAAGVIAGYLIIRAASVAILLIVQGWHAGRGRALSIGVATFGTAGLIGLSTYTGKDAQILLWCGALACELINAAAYFRGWHLVSVQKLAKRFSLIVILGLELSMGRMLFGMFGKPIVPAQPALIVAGLVIGVFLWWLYFDQLAQYGKHRIGQAGQKTRDKLARNYFTYLHPGLIAGTLLVSLATRAAGEDLYHDDASAAGGALPLSVAISLGAGIAIYLATIAAMWRVLGRKWRPTHLAGASLAIAVAPALAAMPALLALYTIASLCLAVMLADYLTTKPERHAIATAPTAQVPNARQPEQAPQFPATPAAERPAQRS